MKHPDREDPTRPMAPDDEARDDAAEAAAEPVLPPEERVAALEGELADAKDRMLRAMAEMENLRRRTAREIDEARKYAITGFARELLEVDDNLSRALESIPHHVADEIGFLRTLADGVALTQKSLAACFERHKIAKVTPEIGEKFDHNRHQAMFEVEADLPPGTIAQVLQPGYVIADRLLRPALVGVAKAPASKPQEPAGDAPGQRVDRTA